MALFQPFFAALNGAGVRYVVVGGLATVLHGYARLTADIDLIVDLEPAAALQTMSTLTKLGLRPRPPVDALAFADPTTRGIQDKGMRFFSLWDPATPMREVDLFVDNPIPFGELWMRSEIVDASGTPIRVVAIADLIALKRLAGRPQDLEDIAALQAIAARRGS